MKCLIFLILAFTFSRGLVFLDPPSLAQLGKIHSPLFKNLLPVADTRSYFLNLTVQIPVDYAGCTPSAQTWTGMLVWAGNLFSCPQYGLSQNFLPQWADFQAAGALGIIESIFVGPGDFTATKLLRSVLLFHFLFF